MAQFARPESDASGIFSIWSEETGTGIDLWDSINEVTPSDADYAWSGVAAPVNEPYCTKLDGAAITDPGVGTGHVLRVRLGKDPSNGEQMDFTIELREGYVDEASQGTLIESFSVTNAAGGFTTHTFNIAQANADNITNYDDLFVRLVANQV